MPKVASWSFSFFFLVNTITTKTVNFDERFESIEQLCGKYCCVRKRIISMICHKCGVMERRN